MFSKIVFAIVIILDLFILLPLPFNYINSDIKSQYNEYMSTTNAICPTNKYNNDNHFIVVTKLPDRYLGVCLATFNKFIILINKQELEMMLDSDKFQLISHELYHCLFNGEHSNEYNNYMYPEMNLINPSLVKVQILNDIINKCK